MRGVAWRGASTGSRPRCRGWAGALRRQQDAASAGADCAASRVLIAPNWTAAPEGRCLFVGRSGFGSDGALALRVTSGGLEVAGARSLNRDRPWTRGCSVPDAREIAVPARSELVSQAVEPGR